MSKKSKRKQLALPEKALSIPALPTPKLYISEDFKLTLHELSKRRLEWSLIGKTEFYKDGVRLVDLIVPKQENSGAHSEVSDDSMLAVTSELVDRGEDLQKWNVHIHSHNTMGAFFSSVDTGRMNEWAIYGVPLFFSIVVSNKAGKLDLLCWSNFYKPLRVDIETTVVYETSTLRDVAAPVDEIAELETRLATLKAEYKEACMGWGNELATLIDDRTEAPYYPPAKKYDYSKKYDYDDTYKKYYDEEEDYTTPMFSANGGLSSQWIKEWLKLTKWNTDSWWEYNKELVNQWKPKNKAEQRFLAFMYAAPITVTDMNRLVAYLRLATDTQWDNFIFQFMDANPDFADMFDEFLNNPFTS